MRDHTDKTATLQNVIDFAAATLHPKIDCQSTRERLQVHSSVPLLFLTSSRPSDFRSSKGALSTAKKASSKKSKPLINTTVWDDYRFFYGIGSDGKIYPDVFITIRPSKTSPNDPAKTRQEQTLAEAAVPAACELVYLLLVLAALDGILVPLPAEQLDGRHVKPSDLNRATRRKDPRCYSQAGLAALGKRSHRLALQDRRRGKEGLHRLWRRHGRQSQVWL